MLAHWLFLLVSQESLCEQIPLDRSLALAKYRGGQPECDKCHWFMLDFEILESFGGTSAPGRIRLRGPSLIPNAEGQLRLLEILTPADGEPPELYQLQPIEGNPDEHPLLQRLRARLPASFPVQVTHDNRPMADVRVMLSRTGVKPMIATTDGDGRVRFEDLAAGVYELVVTRDLYRESKATVAIAPGSCAPRSVELQAANRFAGVFTDDSGNPLVGAELHLFSEPKTDEQKEWDAPRAVATSAEDGSFHFDDLPAGRYSLAVNGMGSASGLLLPKTFYPDLPTIEKAAQFEMQPGTNIEGIRFVLKGLGRRYEVEVRGLGPDGKEEFWHFLGFSASFQGASPVANCCSAWPRLNFVEDADGRKRHVPIEPSRHKVTMFEKLTYTIDTQSIHRDQCMSSLPVTLGEGPKRDVVLRFQKVPCRTW